MAIPKFNLDEVVFAKMRGWPPWPAKVEFFENIPSSNKVKYNVYFYGTNQIAQCKEEDLYPYVEYKDKFGKPKKATGFMKAISQADAELLRLERAKSKTQDSNSFDVDYLKAELQVLKIDKEIKRSLNPKKSNFSCCLRLLDEYSGLQLNPLMFMKNPKLIDTLLKLQVYSGNPNLEKASKLDDEKDSGRDEVLTYLVRQKGREIYLRVQSIFKVPDRSSFLEFFVEKLVEFENSVGDLSKQELLQLSRDPK